MREGGHCDVLTVNHISKLIEGTIIEVRVSVQDGIFLVNWVLLFSRVDIKEDGSSLLDAEHRVE